MPRRTRTPSPEATLDLHGMTQTQAHQLLSIQMARWVAQGLRCMCIVTGKGREGEGVLKREVPRWLTLTALGAHVRDITPAPRTQGGDGALLVFLKRG